MSAPEHPDALDRLRAARPELDDALLSPHTPGAQALMEEIVSMEASPARSSRTRKPLLVAAGATAAAIAIGVAAVATTGATHPSPRAGSTPKPQTTGRVAQLVNIRTIAARSNTALGASGRAQIRFDDPSGYQSGTTDLTFSGSNVAMTIHFAGEAGRPGFDSQNMTVDGEFYLYTPGPDNVSRWYHDTNAGGSSVFDSDPRTLLATLAPEAGFVEVGTDTVDGVEVTHLRATALDALPSLNLSLGPIDAREMKTLDLWVGTDDVVRRLDLTTERHEQDLDPKTAPKLEKHADGTIAIIGPDGRRTVVQASDLQKALEGYPKITRTFSSNYSVHFSDIGVPITIAAPAGAVDIAAEG